jgi:hypothetical protein
LVINDAIFELLLVEIGYDQHQQEGDDPVPQFRGLVEPKTPYFVNSVSIRQMEQMSKKKEEGFVPWQRERNKTGHLLCTLFIK